MSGMLDKVLEKIASRAKILFDHYRWRWGYPILHTPSIPEIKNTLLFLLSKLGQDTGSHAATGRLLVLKTDGGIEIYINIGWIPSDYPNLTDEYFLKLLNEMHEENGEARNEM